MLVQGMGMKQWKFCHSISYLELNHGTEEAQNIIVIEQK